jgi:hypothetical protein
MTGRPANDASITPAQIQAAVKVAHVLYGCVRNAGPGGLPSGHLYAACMSAFSDVASYEACLGILVKAGLVERRGQLLFASPVPA